MAHFVAKILGERPSYILSSWGVSELIVAFGHYSNERSYENFLNWKASREDAPKQKEPKPIAVKFIPAIIEEGDD